MSILYQQVVCTEATIADAVINKMKARENKYIPLNFIKRTLSYYHIDIIDFLEETSDGSSTTHELNCIAFQQHISKSSDIIDLDLPKHCTTKRLQPNIFGNLNCVKPSNNKNVFLVATDKNVKCLTIGKAILFLKNEKLTQR